MDLLAVGYVARAHGVRGELRVHLHDEASTVLFDVDHVWIAGQEIRVRSARPTTGAVLMELDGIVGRDAAEALRGRAVEVERSAVPLAEGEFLVADLVGCEVVDVDGTPLGVVVELMTGAQDVMTIHDDSVERMLPVVPEFVRDVDVAARRVVVELPEDLPVTPVPRRRR